MKTCQDEVIAIIDVKQSLVSIRRPKHYSSTFTSLNAFYRYQDKYHAPIVVVTESPHIEEFRVHGVVDLLSQNEVSARPVNGASGRNIMQYLVSLVCSSGVWLEDGHYPVILMNALHEQCSEGVDTLVHRTKNFLRLWPEKLAFLQQRLTSVKPLMVLCACTVGDFRLQNGDKAYQGGRQAFETHFKTLLRDEFHLTPIQKPGLYNFMGSLDLSGLVLNVIDSCFSATSCSVFKTSHPAAWGYRTPSLRPYTPVYYHYAPTE